MCRIKKAGLIFLQYLPIIAVVFVFFKYYDYHSLSFPRITDWLTLTFSLVFLLSVFLLRTMLWWYVLRVGKIRISFREAFASRNIALLMKYIPGKVWTHVGTTGYLWNKGCVADKVFVLSVFAQCLSILAGLLVGSVGLYFLGPDILKYGSNIVFILFLIVFLGVFYFYKERIGKKVRPFLQVLKSFDRKRLFLVLSLYAAHWIVLGFSFLLFFNALGFHLSWPVLFLQPLANNLGIIAVFAPSGMGVREGAMMMYLNGLGVGAAHASYLAIVSRVWFLAVEVFLFVVAWLLGRSKNKAPNGER